MPDLPTIDILGVDLLAAGGPYHGAGSPPDGDFYTEDDLRRIAENTNAALATGELRSPVKLGHSNEQRLLRESGLSDGEMPAAGWVENLRVENGKILGDLRRVPAKLGELIKVGAFRSRSVELKSLTSQRDGSRVGPVVSGLAWLGAKAPAVRTLDDVVALYHDQEAEEDVMTIEYGEDRTWNPAWGYRAIQRSIHESLAREGNYRVVDIGPDRALALDEGGVSWVVPFSVEDDEVRLSDRKEWELGQPAWADAAEHVIAMCETRASADNQGDMNTQITLSEEQVRAFAEHLGIDPEAFTADDLARLTEEERKLSADEIVVPREELAQLKADAAKGADAGKRLYEMERNQFLHEAVSDGRIDPGDLDKWSARYDDNSEMTREIVSELRPNELYTREFGREGEPGDEERQLAEAFGAYMGVEAEG